MKKLTIFMLSLFVASVSVMAQQDEAPKFANWDPNPKMHAIPPKYFNEHAVVIYDYETRDYKEEGSEITLYSTIHKLIKVLDKTGIESFNTINVPFRGNESRIDSIRARTILPDGTTHEIKYEMLFFGSQSILFALDGVTKNAEIELIVKYKSISSYFGSVHFQSAIPVLHTVFELNYPKQMSFNTKGYHGFPSGKEQMVGAHKQVRIYQQDIPALAEQPNSFYDLYLMRLDYALDHMTTRGGYQVGESYTWDKFAQKLYKDFYTIKRSEAVAVGKFLTSIGIRGAETESQKIKMIEDGIKSTVTQYDELIGSSDDDLDSITTKKAATEVGITRLFCACFKAVGVNHELGMTSNRSEHLLDAKFVNWSVLEDYVIYFPHTDKYLSPNHPYLRYPEIPHSMIANKGVFCKTNPETMFSVGSTVVAPEAIVRMISAPAAGYTKIDQNIAITFNDDMDPEAEATYSYTGYGAADLRVALASANAENKKKLIEGQILIADKPEKIVKYNTVNEAFNAVYKAKPLEIKATVRVPELLDKAGSKYMLRIGDAIGTAPNLYDKRERILPVDINYPHTKTDVITVYLPVGCKVLNANALRIHAEQGDLNNGLVTAFFNSDYTLVGNKLTVTVTQSFTQVHYPVIEFEAYKKVVNAAADFNKISLLLEPAKMKKAAKAPKAKVAAVKTPAKHV